MTGPAKNLIEFAQRARDSAADLPAVELSIGAYRRGGEPESAFIQAARAAGIAVDVIPERGRFDRSVTTEIRRIAAAARSRYHPDAQCEIAFFSALERSLARKGMAGLSPRLHRRRFQDALLQRGKSLVLTGPASRGHGLRPFCRTTGGARHTARAHQRAAQFREAVSSPLDDEVDSPRAGFHPGAGRHADPDLHRPACRRRKGISICWRRWVCCASRECAFHAVFVGEGVERRRIEAARDRLGLAAACHSDRLAA